MRGEKASTLNPTPHPKDLQIHQESGKVKQSHISCCLAEICLQNREADQHWVLQGPLAQGDNALNIQAPQPFWMGIPADTMLFMVALSGCMEELQTTQRPTLGPLSGQHVWACTVEYSVTTGKSKEWK